MTEQINVVITEAPELTPAQHKRYAEHYLHDAKQRRDKVAERINTEGFVLVADLDAALGLLNVTLQLAQIHATLATARTGYR